MNEELPTAPGFKVTPRVRRQFDRSFDAVVFDLPVVPVTYVGTRKVDRDADLKRRERETNVILSINIVFALGLVIITTLLANGY